MAAARLLRVLPPKKAETRAHPGQSRSGAK
jgi:hypothetical protein